MRTMMGLAAGLLLASLTVGCGQSEAERQAETERQVGALLLRDAGSPRTTQSSCPISKPMVWSFRSY